MKTERSGFPEHSERGGFRQKAEGSKGASMGSNGDVLNDGDIDRREKKKRETAREGGSLYNVKKSRLSHHG